MKEFIKKIPILSDGARFVKNIPSSFAKKKKKKEDIARIRSMSRKSPLKVVVGASGVFDDGWIGTEQSFLDLTVQSDWAALFDDQSIDALLAEHVWEHLTYEDGLAAAKLCHRYIKPGGYFRVAVPDGNHPQQDYIDSVKIGGHGEGADDHKVLYTLDKLSEQLRSAGFEVSPLEYFDAEKKFHHHPWDKSKGMIFRTSEHDERNSNGVLNYTSLLIDAYKK